MADQIASGELFWGSPRSGALGRGLAQAVAARALVARVFAASVSDLISINCCCAGRYSLPTPTPSSRGRARALISSGRASSGFQFRNGGARLELARVISEPSRG